MVKTFLHGNVAYRYVGLARHLYQKLPEGQKKIYQVGQAQIEVCKVNPFNYIRIRAEEKPEQGIALFLVYNWYEVDNRVYLKLEFWRVFASGKIDIIIADQRDFFGNTPIQEVLCGRFRLISPLSAVVYFDTGERKTLYNNVDYRYYTCPSHGGKITRIVDYAWEERAFSYEFTLDFNKMKYSFRRLSHYIKAKETGWVSYLPYVDTMNPCDWHYWNGMWALYTHVGGRRYYRTDKLVLDVFPTETIKELYVSGETSETWYDISDSPTNPAGEQLPGSPCPPSSKSKWYNYTYWNELWWSEPRTKIKKRTSLVYSGEFLLEDSEIFCCTREYDTGFMYEHDVGCITPRNFLRSLIYAYIVNATNFIWCYYEKDKDTDFRVALGGQILDTFSVSYDSWVYKNCRSWWAPPDGTSGLDLTYCYRAGHGQSQYLTFPAITLLTHKNHIFSVNPRFIKDFSYMWGSFEIESIFKKSFYEDKEYQLKSQDGLFLAYQNPLNPKQYYGIYISDTADYSFCGLGYSNPMQYAGPFFLPFTRWDIENEELVNPKFSKKKNGGQGFPNPSYEDFLIIPAQPFNGFFVGKEGTPPGIKSALLGSSILQDVILLQKADKQWYINGEELKYSFDEKKLLGG